MLITVLRDILRAVMRYAVRAVISSLLILGCAPETSEPYTLSECDENGRCWVWASGWYSWALSYAPEHIAALEDAESIVPILPAPAGDACWAVGPSGLPLCAVEVDELDVYGHPLEIGENLHEIVLEPSDCAALAPWDEVRHGRGFCFGVIDGVAVRLDPDRPLPARLAL